LAQQPVGVLVAGPLPGLRGSQKYTGTPVSLVNRACSAISLPWSQVKERRSRRPCGRSRPRPHWRPTHRDDAGQARGRAAAIRLRRADRGRDCSDAGGSAAPPSIAMWGPPARSTVRMVRTAKTHDLCRVNSATCDFAAIRDYEGEWRILGMRR
jgi:hypothetical protein